MSTAVMKVKAKEIRANLMLLLTAVIWGTAFVAQSVGMDYIGPFTFNGSRNILAGLALLVVIAVRRRRGEPAMTPQARRQTWIGGVCCGVVLFVASTLQQFGMVEADAGKAGFITALYIVIVPLLGLLWGRRPRAVVWLAVGLAAAGLYLLCIQGQLTLARGDFLILCCAGMFSVHILVIDHFSPRGDGVRMSCIQFFTAGVLSLVGMAFFETPSIQGILDAWAPILYAGLLSSGVGYTLQIIAQRDTSPAVASLLMSLEAVFAAIAGWLLLGETFSSREMLGAALMFAAILLAQVPPRKAAAPSHE